MAIPALAFVALLMSWVIALGVCQGQLQFAARDGARAAARGDSATQVAQAVARVAPGATARVVRTGRLVRVEASQLRSPGAILRGLSRTLHASAVAQVEP